MVERVADYPRPPSLLSSNARVEVSALGVVICKTQRSLRVLETFHPPTYYLPPDSMRRDLLVPQRFLDGAHLGAHLGLKIADVVGEVFVDRRRDLFAFDRASEAIEARFQVLHRLV